MTSDQVKLIRDTYNANDGNGNTLAFATNTVFDNEISIKNTDDFVIYDDANELVHCVCLNADGPVSQTISPYKIVSSFYSNILYMEGFFNMENLKKVIKQLFVDTGLINNEQEKAILTWASSIRPSVPQPDNMPYFPDTPLPVPSVFNTKKPVREDGIIHASSIGMESYKNDLFNKINSAMQSSFTDSTLTRVAGYNYTARVASPVDAIGELVALCTALDSDVKLINISTEIDKAYAVYNPAEQSTKDNIQTALENIILADTKQIKIAVEGLNPIRIDVQVRFIPKDAPMSANEYRAYILDKFKEYIDSIDGAKLDSNGVTATLTTTNIEGDLGLTDFLMSLEHTHAIAANYAVINEKAAKKHFASNMPKPGQSLPIAITLSSTDGSNTKVYLTFNISVPASASVNGVRYATMAEAFTAAATKGGTLKLLKDESGLETVTVQNGVDLTIDLNGNELSFKPDQYLNVDGGTVSIIGDGVISSSLAKSYKPTIYVFGNDTDQKDYSVVTIGEHVTIKNEGSYGIAIGHKNKKAYGAKIIVNGTVESAYGFTVTGNAIATDGDNIPEIVVGVTGKIISTNGGAIYAAGYGKYNIIGTVIGTEFGVEIRAGELTVWDTANIVSTDNFSDPAPNGNGSTVTGSAIAVSQHTTNLPIHVTVKGGTVSGTGMNGYALYEIDTVKNESEENVAKDVSIEILDGKFHGGVYSTNNKLTISGGKFTVNVSDYCADGKRAIVTDNDDYPYYVV